METLKLARLGAMAIAVAPTWAMAQETLPAPAAAMEVAPSALCCIIPVGTVVELEVTEAVSTKTHKRGDKFALRLVRPIVVDGRALVPADVVGVGEVVHAAKAGMAGKAAELIVAGRSLTYDGVTIPLRGFSISAHSKSQSDEATAVVVLAGVVGLLIKADEIQITSGAQATAKVSAAVTIPPHTDAAPTPRVTAPPTSAEG